MNRYPPKKTGNGVRNALLAFTAVSLVAGASAASAGVIKVGVSLRMKTETGEKYGQMVADEFEAINAAGGVNGNTIEVKLLNDECKSDIGVANATKYAYQDNVHLFIGSSCSSVSLPIVDVLHKAGVPMLIRIPLTTRSPSRAARGCSGYRSPHASRPRRPRSTRPRTSAPGSPTSGRPTPPPRPTRRSSTSTSRPTTGSCRCTPSSSRRASSTFGRIF